ncbi:MAG: hypothetical protein JOY62_00735 [Acidobacteriaceae bacterium]|nr:hypothetical protein [Acidobacteriaceae bacterium]
MDQLIRRCEPKSGSLASALRAIIDEGLVYEDGCVLLKSQFKLVQSNLRKHFQDETGYECFVNHVHLEDILTSAGVCLLLEQALLLANELSALKLNVGLFEPLEYIIVSDGNEMNVRFHVVRSGQSWLADDLGVYAEAVAALRLPGA